MRRSFLALAVSLTSLANWNDTSTGIDLNKLPHFPLVKLRSGWLKDGSRAKFDGITATAASGGVREVRLRGVGRSGKRWEAHIFGLDEVWRGDLDGNGIQDYVFFAGGPYFNGRTTPLFSLSILLMDTDGMPVPFFTVAYHRENGDGIKHLVDLNRDGRAELLISMYDENVSDPLAGSFSSGHWTTQLYRFRDLGAEEVRGTIGGLSFPFVHPWTYRGTGRGEADSLVSPVQPPALYEHGTVEPREVMARILGSGVGVDGFSIEPVAGCKAIFPAVVVYDRSRIREIGFPSMWNSYATDLVETIRRDGAEVQLRGISQRESSGHCSVNLIWATK